MVIFKELSCGGVETKESDTILNGWKIYPNNNEMLKRLRDLYYFEELLEIIGYDEQCEEEEEFKALNRLEKTDYDQFVECVEHYCCENGSFEESLLLNKRVN